MASVLESDKSAAEGGIINIDCHMVRPAVGIVCTKLPSPTVETYGVGLRVVKRTVREGHF